MTSRSRNIVLIGMPGSGKSTIGRRLATRFGLSFVDTDKLLEAAENKPIQAIVDKRGLRYFMQLEEQILSSLELDRCVIATGGSAVYSQAAMRHLAEIGTRVYLYITPWTMLRRVNNASTRGLVKLPRHPLLRLYREREALCEAVADVNFDNNKPISAVNMARLEQQILEFEAR